MTEYIKFRTEEIEEILFWLNECNSLILRAPAQAQLPLEKAIEKIQKYSFVEN